MANDTKTTDVNSDNTKDEKVIEETSEQDEQTSDKIAETKTETKTKTESKAKTKEKTQPKAETENEKKKTESDVESDGNSDEDSDEKSKAESDDSSTSDDSDNDDSDNKTKPKKDSDVKPKDKPKTAEEKKLAEQRKQAPASIKFSKKPHKDALWYVVHTYSGHERKVAITLRERVSVMNLQDRINEVLIPTQKKIIISAGKKKEIDERMFPGYILVQAALDDNVWHAIRSTPGVTGFVGIGNQPTPLSNKEVDSIVKFMKIDTPKFEAKFKEDDAVKITDGAFKDFMGKVSKVMTDQGRLEVLVSVFDRETPVEVDFTQVIPA